MKNFFGKWKKSKIALSQPVEDSIDDKIPDGISKNLQDNTVMLYELFGESFDLVIKPSEVCGNKIAFVALDGMYDNLLVSQAVIHPVCETKTADVRPVSVYEHIRQLRIGECDTKEALLTADAVNFLISGCLLLFVDGVDRCLAFSVQGYPKKGIEPPASEQQEMGSHEGFVDMYKDNVTLVRRRFKNPYVRFETVTVGKESNTTVCVCYHAKRASPEIVNDVKGRLQKAKLDIVAGSGALIPFLENKRMSFFSSVGYTERPDVFCAKLAEGRVGLIVDGSPTALLMPYLFIENFHSLDDYLSRPYYAVISRILKIVCFFIASFLPGTFVAVGTFHQEIFPSEVIFEIVSSLKNTPFPLVVECVVIHLIYEIVREAGLRMPKAVGHTVSIVGALVIGDAAVSAGLISAPMLIVIAITAIASAVTPSLHQPSSVLRLIFIIVGGIMGLYGIMLGFSLVIADLCSVSSFGVPFTAPFSPFDFYASRDSVFFAGWKSVGKRFAQIHKLKGSDIDAENS
ncbi:MAG: spore germination protein [Clostridia bacterium]|nr:spore germination protein [Clostridia bacterium]